MTSYAISHIGNVRIENEDSFYCSDGKESMYVVADWMGGHIGGKIASKTAVDVLTKFFNANKLNSANEIKNVLLEIQNQYNIKISQNQDLVDMGSTLTATFIKNNIVDLIHVGDSRCYLLSGNNFSQITNDHTLANKLYLNGKYTKLDKNLDKTKHILLRAVVAKGNIDIDHLKFMLYKGDMLLLCTDGLTGYLKDGELKSVLLEDSTLQDKANKLLNLALDRGGKDNITLIIVKNEEEDYDR